MVQVVQFEGAHVEEGAALAARRFAALRKRVPCLPPRYESPGALTERLARLNDHGLGVAAFDGGRMVGVLAGFSIGSLRGRSCTLSPEWANGTEGRSGRVLEAMYSEVVSGWLGRGDELHVICTLAHDPVGLDAWAAAGFGRLVCDAVRSLEPLAATPGDFRVRRATPNDVKLVLPLAEALSDHLAAAPTYVLDRDPEEPQAWEATLGDPTTAVWLAERGSSALGYLRLGPAADDACDVIVDEKTTSITGAYVAPSARCRGVATALLARAIDWGREQGYERSSVDFETANGSAARFWLAHFDPIVVSLARTHDPRSVGLGAGGEPTL